VLLGLMLLVGCVSLAGSVGGKSDSVISPAAAASPAMTDRRACNSVVVRLHDGQNPRAVADTLPPRWSLPSVQRAPLPSDPVVALHNRVHRGGFAAPTGSYMVY